MKSNRPWLALLSELYAPPSPEEARRENESFGRLLVDLGLATRRQIDACLAAAPPRKGRPFPRLSRLLIDQGVITPDQLAGSVIATAAEDPENRLGAYVLVGKIRGETWKAWNTVGRAWVQITFVPPEVQERLRPRVAVSHRGLARILELGAADGRTFVAAEHVQGMSLATAPRTDRVPLLAAIRDAAEAVGALHARKLVHGAISLDSILIDGDGAVRVVGWGDADNDVTALGEALFELATDRPAPKDGLPKPWPKRLDEPLRSILAKALGDKYASAADFAKDLARALR